MTVSWPTSGDEIERLAEITDVVVAIASFDFSKRARVGDGAHLLDGLATGLNMLAEEVSQRHERERAYQQHLLQNERLIAVGQLAAGIAHEINNPAAFVLSNLTVLVRELESVSTLATDTEKPELPAALGRALVAAKENLSGIERIVSIVRELRNFARLEPARLESLALESVIADACALVRAEVMYRAQLVVEAPTTMRVRGDRTKLTQVFTNLLLNASQAIAEGAASDNQVTVTGRVRGDWATVTVQDTGEGMTEEAEARMFEPFFTTKSRDLGTGLGLAISADIVRHHGGELRMTGTSDRGTTFEVRLPRDLEALEPATVNAPAPPSAREAAAVASDVDARRTRLLIVDDEPMLLRAYQRALATWYDIAVAASGAAALERLTQDDGFDVILCDLMMPDMDGVAVHEWVRSHRGALSERMLFSTGGAFTPRTIEFSERFRDRVLQKPVPLDELRAAIDRIRLTGCPAPDAPA